MSSDEEQRSSDREERRAGKSLLSATWAGVLLTLVLILLGLWGNATQIGGMAQQIKDDQSALTQERSDRIADVNRLSSEIRELWTMRRTSFTPSSSSIIAKP